MAKRRMIYEGKAKVLYEGPESGTIIQYFKDEATAYNAQKKAEFEGKGTLNNLISERIMSILSDCNIPNHFIKRLNMREQLIKEVEIIPVEVVVRNIAAGSFSQRLGIAEATRLPRSIVEYCYKSDELSDPIIAEEHVTAMNWATPQELDDMLSLSLRINDILSGLFHGIGVMLVDFKLEFGRYYDDNGEMRVILADEISPDTCRLWDKESGEKMDKDRFRRDLGDFIKYYREVAQRLGVLSQ